MFPSVVMNAAGCTRGVFVNFHPRLHEVPAAIVASSAWFPTDTANDSMMLRPHKVNLDSTGVEHADFRNPTVLLAMAMHRPGFLKPQTNIPINQPTKRLRGSTGTLRKDVERMRVETRVVSNLQGFRGW